MAERGPWGSYLEEAHAKLLDDESDAPLHLYAVLAEGGFELAQVKSATTSNSNPNPDPGDP